jgi:hypothetical protein
MLEVVFATRITPQDSTETVLLLVVLEGDGLSSMPLRQKPLTQVLVLTTEYSRIDRAVYSLVRYCTVLMMLEVVFATRITPPPDSMTILLLVVVEVTCYLLCLYRYDKKHCMY